MSVADSEISNGPTPTRLNFGKFHTRTELVPPKSSNGNLGMEVKVVTVLEDTRGISILASAPQFLEHRQYWLQDVTAQEPITTYLSSNSFVIVNSLAQDIICVVPTLKIREDLIFLADQINAYLRKLKIVEQGPEANGQTGTLKIQPKVGEILLVPRSSRSSNRDRGQVQYYRGIVKATLPLPNDELIDVYLIDIGRKLRVSWTNCYPVTQELLKQPIFCYPIKLTQVSQSENPRILWSKFNKLIRGLIKETVKLELTDMNPTDSYYATGEIILANSVSKTIKKEILSTLINDLAKWEWEQIYDLGCYKTDKEIIGKCSMEDFDYAFKLTLTNYKIPLSQEIPVKVKIHDVTILPPLKSESERKLFFNIFCTPCKSVLPEFDRLKKTYKAQLSRYMDKIQPSKYFPGLGTEVCLISTPGFYDGKWLRGLRITDDRIYFLDKHVFKEIDDPMAVKYRQMIPEFFDIPKFVIETMIEVSVTSPESLQLAQSVFTKGSIISIRRKENQAGCPDLTGDAYISSCIEYEFATLGLGII